VQIIGHDRGARVAFRLTVDNPEFVSSAMFMDVVTTNTIFAGLFASSAF